MIKFFSDETKWTKLQEDLLDYIDGKSEIQGYIVTGKHGIGKSYRIEQLCNLLKDFYDVIPINTLTIYDIFENSKYDRGTGGGKSTRTAKETTAAAAVVKAPPVVPEPKKKAADEVKVPKKRGRRRKSETENQDGGCLKSRRHRDIEVCLQRIMYTQDVTLSTEMERKRKIFILDDLETISSFVKLKNVYTFFLDLIELNPEFKRMRHIVFFVGNLNMVKIRKTYVNRIKHYNMLPPSVEEAERFVRGKLTDHVDVDLIATRLCRYIHNDIGQLIYHTNCVKLLRGQDDIEAYINNNIYRKQEELKTQAAIEQFYTCSSFKSILQLLGTYNISNDSSGSGGNSNDIYDDDDYSLGDKNSISFTSSSVSSSKANNINIFMSCIHENYIWILWKNWDRVVAARGGGGSSFIDSIYEIIHILSKYDHVVNLYMNKDSAPAIQLLDYELLATFRKHHPPPNEIQINPKTDIIYTKLVNRKSTRSHQRYYLQQLATTMKENDIYNILRYRSFYARQFDDIYQNIMTSKKKKGGGAAVAPPTKQIMSEDRAFLKSLINYHELKTPQLFTLLFRTINKLVAPLKNSSSRKSKTAAAVVAVAEAAKVAKKNDEDEEDIEGGGGLDDIDDDDEEESEFLVADDDIPERHLVTLPKFKVICPQTSASTLFSTPQINKIFQEIV